MQKKVGCTPLGEREAAQHAAIRLVDGMAGCPHIHLACRYYFNSDHNKIRAPSRLLASG
jgi:hypothetical protein